MLDSQQLNYNLYIKVVLTCCLQGMTFVLVSVCDFILWASHIIYM